MKTDKINSSQKPPFYFTEENVGLGTLKSLTPMNANEIIKFVEHYDWPVHKTESDFFINCCMKKGYVGPFKVYLDLNTMQLKYIQVGECSAISFMMFKALFKKEKAFLASLGIKLKEARR